MIANVLNFLIGLGVSYFAIFATPSATVPWILPVGVAIVVLALIARRSDFSGWQSATNIVLGIVLLVISVINWAVIPVSPLVTFWINLWVGLTVASLALWAALYHPKEGAVEAEVRVAADSR